MKNKWLVKLVGSVVLASSCLSSAIASPDSTSDWYLHVDVKSLKNSELSANVGGGDAKDVYSVAEVILGKEFVNQTKYLTVYGDVGDETAKTMLARGDYQSISDQTLAKMAKLGLSDKKEVEGIDVYSGFLKKVDIDVEETERGDDQKLAISDIHLEYEGDSEIKLYAAFLSSDTVAVTQDEAEINRLIKEGAQWQPENQQSLFEVVVDIEKAMVHGGVNLDEAAEVVNFESISAKKLKQVSATYKENNGNIELQVGLRAADTQTAAQVLSVAQGLMALKILSENDQVVVDLLNTVRIEQNAEDLLLVLSGSSESFKALLDKAHSH